MRCRISDGSTSTAFGTNSVYESTRFWVPCLKASSLPLALPLGNLAVECATHRPTDAVGEILGTMAKMAEKTRIRDYDAGDAPEIARLFYGTVRSVNRADYSVEQVEAWAPGVPDPDEWHARMAGRKTLVAEEDGEVVGFAELEEDGHLDMIYLRD